MSDDDVIFADATLHELASAVDGFRGMLATADGRRWLAANRSEIERELDDLRLILSCAGDDHLPLAPAKWTPAVYHHPLQETAP